MGESRAARMNRGAEYLGDNFNIGSVDRFRVFVKKKNPATGVYEPWANLTEVKLKFEGPDRETSFVRSCVAEDALNGVWFYDSVPTDITEPGPWTVSVFVREFGVEKTFAREIGFRVMDQGGPG